MQTEHNESIERLNDNSGSVWQSIVYLLRVAAWAPISVLILHAIVLRTPWRQTLDWLLYFLGGAATAYFLFHAARLLTQVLGQLRMPTHYMLAFGLTCTIAVGWEIIEFLSDQILGTQVQHSLVETMRDLICGVLGAVFSLVCVLLLMLVRGYSRTIQKSKI